MIRARDREIYRHEAPSAEKRRFNASMEKILVEEKEEMDKGWVFEVRVGEDPDVSVHKVIMPKDYWERLTDSRYNREELVLVRKSFEFLLAREPKESILREFELPVIQKYFPEYESEMRKTVA